MHRSLAVSLLAALLALAWAAPARSGVSQEHIYRTGELAPIDSTLKVRPGDPAPDFSLPAVDGSKVTLSSFKGRKNVVLSFVPAAFTPVCSDQWPGYNIARPLFEEHDAVLLGVSTDNIPSLYAWTREMGELWFPALSDFWPHGAVASAYGVLRSTGVAERAVFVIDKRGVIRYVDVHDINRRPDLGLLMQELSKLDQAR
ncbi:MAG: peroxiredoxin [Desulfovibrionaceae bacterium]|nr:peroxiredoxin [Desulfovibrionaceae bacterium]